MSEKIKSKDLKYDTTLPPFLQRLHNQNASRGDTDRHERQIARPKKAKDPNDEDDPTVVDESGETVSKDELAKLTETTSAAEGDANVKGETDLDAEPKASGALPSADADDRKDSKSATSNVTDGTAQKKRKAAKIVGADDGAEATGEEPGVPKPTKKVKKKPKVKLAFEEDE